MSHAVFGFIAAGLEFAFSGAYIWGILYKGAIPSRMSWVIWTILSYINLATSYIAGAHTTLPMFMAIAFMNTITLMFALYHGK